MTVIFRLLLILFIFFSLSAECAPIYAKQYPEIYWLTDGDVRNTEEGQAKDPQSIEFDRTLMTLRCLNLFLEGSDTAYQEFTRDQPKETKISKESFHHVHLQAQKLLKSQGRGLSEQDWIQTMETALVLGDLGKSEKARHVFKPYGASAPDHDDFYEEAIKILGERAQLCPSFARLPEAAQQLLVKVANLAHYGHITHLEGGPAMFTKLKQSRILETDPLAHSFDLLIHTCDVAGALGHVNAFSSLVYTELTHQALNAVGEAIKVLADPSKTEWDAYQHYLNTRASWLGLNVQDRKERVLTRVGAMLRLFTPEDGAVLKQAMEQLKESSQQRLIAQFDIQPSDLSFRTPTYMPAVLVNLSNNPKLGATREERLIQAVVIGVNFISKVLGKYKDQPVTLNFNRIAGLAKTSPEMLYHDFYVDAEGHVNIMRHSGNASS